MTAQPRRRLRTRRSPPGHVSLGNPLHLSTPLL